LRGASWQPGGSQDQTSQSQRLSSVRGSAGEDWGCLYKLCIFVPTFDLLGPGKAHGSWTRGTAEMTETLFISEINLQDTTVTFQCQSLYSLQARSSLQLMDTANSSLHLGHSFPPQPTLPTYPHLPWVSI
jgi:hypothetical protein